MLAALAGRRLGLALGLEAVGAWAAGALYAFHTNQIHETPRLHVIFHAFLALALEQLVILLATGRRIAAWAAAGFLLLQGLSSNYMLLYGALLVGLVLGGVAIVRPRRAWEGGRQLILPAVAAAAAFLPVALPYARQTAVHDLGRALPVGFDLLHLLQPLKSNVLYGPLFSELAPSGRVGFVGFFAAALAAYALLAGRVPTPSPGWIPARVWVPAAAALAAVFGILALGRDVALAGEMIGPGPYRLLYAWVPGFDLVRFPERLMLLGMLFVGLLAGRGITLMRQRGLPVVAMTLAALVPLEHVSPYAWGDFRVPVGRNVPTAYRWLATQPVAALIELPVISSRYDIMSMYLSTYHWKWLVLGYGGYLPRISLDLREKARYLSAANLEALREVGVDTALVHLPPAALAKTYASVTDAGRAVFAAHFGLAPLDFYQEVRRLESAGRLVRVAEFDRGPARIPGGRDVVFRIEARRTNAPGP